MHWAAEAAPTGEKLRPLLKSANQPLSATIALALLGGLVFFALLAQRDLVTSHEARVAQTARIMAGSGWPWDATPQRIPQPELVQINGEKRLRPGAREMQVNPWIIPILNGEVRLNKPPLPYWCCAVMFKLFGVSEFSARLFPAMLGMLGILLIYDLARMLIGSRTALIAAGVWITSQFIVLEFRKTTADGYLAFFTLLAIWGWARRDGKGWIVFYAALGLGILAKGPVIFITVAPAIIAGLLRYRPTSNNWRWHVIGALISLSVASPWVLAVLRQTPNALELWKYDALESQEKSRPFYRYLLSLPALALPWTPMWIASLVLPFLHQKRKLRTPWNRRRLFLLAWLGIGVLLFSIKPVKKDAYLLPLMPAMVLSIAEAIRIVLHFAKRWRFAGLPGILLIAQTVIGIGFALGVGVLLVRHDPRSMLAWTALVVLVLSSLQPLLPLQRRASNRWLTAQIAGYAVILAIFAGMWSSLDDNKRSPRSIARRIHDYAQANRLPICLARSPEELSFYLPLQSEPWSAERVLLVLDRPTADELKDPQTYQQRFDASVEAWQIIGSLHDPRYVVVEVILNRSKA